MDDLSQIAFMVRGQAGCVLPRYNNTIYFTIKEGRHFGAVDIVGSCMIKGIEFQEWFQKRRQLQYYFTTMAITRIDVLFLTESDLNCMQ